MFMAEHVSHGPGFGFAVGLFGDHLRIGLHGFARPGPMNPATFALELDESYKEMSALSLRSDGGLLGPSVQIGTDVGQRFRADLGATLGYGGFGFYLVGEDRKTPDGRLPSAWEDELMDGRDSSLGLGLDVGPRFSWRVSASVAPYVAARYTTIFGYDAFLKPDYDGVSVGLGISVGRL